MSVSRSYCEKISDFSKPADGHGGRSGDLGLGEHTLGAARVVFLNPDLLPHKKALSAQGFLFEAVGILHRDLFTHFLQRARFNLADPFGRNPIFSGEIMQRGRCIFA